MMVIVPSGAMLTQGLSALPVRSLPTLTFAAVDRVAEDPGPVELASHADRDLEVQALADGGATAERPRDGMGDDVARALCRSAGGYGTLTTSRSKHRIGRFGSPSSRNGRATGTVWMSLRAAALVGNNIACLGSAAKSTAPSPLFASGS